MCNGPFQWLRHLCRRVFSQHVLCSSKPFYSIFRALCLMQYAVMRTTGKNSWVSRYSGGYYSDRKSMFRKCSQHFDFVSFVSGFESERGPLNLNAGHAETLHGSGCFWNVKLELFCISAFDIYFKKIVGSIKWTSAFILFINDYIPGCFYYFSAHMCTIIAANKT